MSIKCPAFEYTEPGTQSYESGRQVSGLSSEFSIVQILLGLENLHMYSLRNMGVSAFRRF